MSTTLAMSAEEIRLRERRSFDAFNEEQAERRQIRRDRFAAQEEESKRWVKRDVDTDDTGDFGENDSLGG
jgi:hypothetical protein